jgi:hypothetical protein
VLIAALISLSVLMSIGILISFSEVQHCVKIGSFKGLQSDPTFFHADSFSSFSTFPAPTSPPLWQRTSIE